MRIATVAALFFLTLSLLASRLATGQSSEQDIESSFRAGQAALRQGDFTRATEEFKKVLALWTQTCLRRRSTWASHTRAYFDYDLAVRHLAKALRERPDLPSLNVIVGMDYLKLGSPEKATPVPRSRIEARPFQP
jgi:tetratricopeptide (TPR) repeat protein